MYMTSASSHGRRMGAVVVIDSDRMLNSLLAPRPRIPKNNILAVPTLLVAMLPGVALEDPTYGSWDGLGVVKVHLTGGRSF